MAADSRCLLDSLNSETVEVPTAATNRTHIVALQYRGQINYHSPISKVPLNIFQKSAIDRDAIHSDELSVAATAVDKIESWITDYLTE
jgi:hypothetical protein